MLVKDLCETIIDNRGKTPPLSKCGYPLIEAQCFSNKNFVCADDAVKFINKTTYNTMRNGNCKINDIILILVGAIGHTALAKSDFAIAQNVVALRIKQEFNAKFVFYKMKEQSFINKCKALNRSSQQPSININDFLMLPIDIPDRKTQDKIAEILSGIDEQINRNNEIVKRLQVLGNAIYSKEINKNTKYFSLKTVANISTGKKDANFASPNGKYNFYTCSEEISKCNEYVFNGDSVLIAGNGNFNVKYYNGKFNAYQRTYVIQNDTLFGNIYYSSLRSINTFTKNANGSIIKFITLGLIQDIQIPIFTNKVNQILNDIVYKRNSIILETERLNRLNNTLLPLLINGQLEI